MFAERTIFCRFLAAGLCEIPKIALDSFIHFVVS